MIDANIYYLDDPVGRELERLRSQLPSQRFNYFAAPNERQPVKDQAKRKAKRKLQRKARKANR